MWAEDTRRSVSDCKNDRKKYWQFLQLCQNNLTFCILVVWTWKFNVTQENLSQTKYTILSVCYIKTERFVLYSFTQRKAKWKSEILELGLLFRRFENIFFCYKLTHKKYLKIYTLILLVRIKELLISYLVIFAHFLSVKRKQAYFVIKMHFSSHIYLYIYFKNQPSHNILYINDKKSFHLNIFLMYRVSLETWSGSGNFNVKGEKLFLFSFSWCNV